MSDFDEHPISIPCLKCEHEMDYKIGWLQSNPEFACASFGAPIVIDSTKLMEERRMIEKRPMI